MLDVLTAENQQLRSNGDLRWDRLRIAVYSLQLIVYSLRLISWLFADNLQISCDFLGGFEKKA